MTYIASVIITLFFLFFLWFGWAQTKRGHATMMRWGCRVWGHLWCSAAHEICDFVATYSLVPHCDRCRIPRPQEQTGPGALREDARV